MAQAARGKKSRWIYSWKFTFPALLIITLTYLFAIAPRLFARRVHRFCESVNIGSPQELIIERSARFGLDVEFARTQESKDQNKTLSIRAFPGFFLKQFGCTVRAVNGKVIDKKED